MKLRFPASNGMLAIAMLASTQLSTLFADSPWPQFRGVSGNGIVSDQSIPLQFGETDNVAWKTELPGKAWSSPVIADGVIWVTTAIENMPNEQERIELLKQKAIEAKKFKQVAIAKSISLKLLAVDLDTGKQLHTIELAEINAPDPIHTLNSYASPTPVIDGDHIYCHFGTFGTFCVNRTNRQIIWNRTLPLEHGVGPGSSPFVYRDRLVLIQDGMDRQYVTALDKTSGETVWETDRPELEAPSGEMKKSYCTPIAVTDKQGREQLICMGSQWIVAYAPSDGSEIWKAYHGKGFSVVPRPVYGDGVVYFCTGFGKPMLFAVNVEGSGDVTDTHVLWQVKKGIPAKPSPVLHDGLVYVIDDNGVASCFDAKNGDEVWKQRIGGKYSASPVLVGGHLLIGSHEGKVTLIQPGREGKIVAENEVDGQIMASPAIVNNALILRTDKALYRIEG
ncbi:secreted protein [Rhodopirellula maiorica SM1]|uniref:Secreted protein n=1 Tax=Rhodopirellula maiorica SM1 TaxID=1265738 RepID=M5RFY7_9BACT|nr:PQQ-binding-like beta-propeller repeat protein [Rhodopirellula maiorica]EMI18278.1 secreted protein [Rhodopirellula maiorica SM1]